MIDERGRVRKMSAVKLLLAFCVWASVCAAELEKFEVYFSPNGGCTEAMSVPNAASIMLPG
jgi:hypothetical protein